MNRKTKGRLAELKVMSYMVTQGYEIYVPFSNNSKYDLLAARDGKVMRVSVKYTSRKRTSGSWEIEMRQISRRKNRINIDKFDSAQYDFVAVYIGPEDKVVLVDAFNVGKRSLIIGGDLLER